MNHMLADGAGFKEYLYLLSELYSNLLENLDYAANLSLGSRSLKQVFDQLSRNEIKSIFTEKTKQKAVHNPTFPLKGDPKNPKTSSGITNLTANITCQISADNVIRKHTSSRQKPLRIYYLLELIFKKKNYKKASEKMYSIPKTSFTNIGIIDEEKLVFEGSTLTDCFICL
ncbi:4-dihydroxy-2-butanone 4-phosphate synthase [Listeria monocytogenes]|nr:4-dihydroxy-2-butanone 4-phosphate synthase [Listeria monocytogenes]